MYSGHARLCVCMSVCLCLAAFPHYCTDPDVTLGNDSGCPLVVHYWMDLQLVHGFRCYDNIARMRNVSECSVLALCLVLFVIMFVVVCAYLSTEFLGKFRMDCRDFGMVWRLFSILI